MATKRSKKPYYHAGGQRVTLEPAADLVAVDDARLAEKLPDLAASDDALRAGKPLRGGIRLVRSEALKPETLDRLTGAGVTQPVFRRDGAVLVALPEIRIENLSKAERSLVLKFAAGKARQVPDDAEGRLTLQPLSGDGRDALALANELVEHLKLTSVSPHFLRVVPGPGVRK